MLKAVNDNLVLEVSEDKSEYQENGIWLPYTLKGDSHEHKVLSVGPDVKRVKVGMTVLADKYKGEKVDLKGQEYLLIKESELLAII